ncbi:MAG: HAMP domain-containing sensor histidine kinase [bacterium]
MFFWSLIGLFDFLIFASSLYLLYTYELNKDAPFWLKIIVGLLILPLLILTPTKFSIVNFDYTNCTAVDNLFDGYLYFSLFVISLITIIIAIRKYYLTSKDKRGQIFLVSLGVALFLISVFGTYYIADTFEKYYIEIYGVFAMTFFMAFLAYLIVKFKAFDIKLVATQALVWALVIIIGSQFFFIQNNTNRILTAINLIMTIIVGIFLVRIVKREVALREDLEIANNNQQSLIHFISHQLKGFFTKSKMIFAGILEDDFEKSSDTLKEAAKEGLLSDDNAVAMIQSILGVANYKKGIITYNMENVDLIEIVNNVCDSFTNEITAKGLELKKDISESPVMILADHTQISQVIKNLIDNSIKYTPAGSIKVSLKARSVNNKKKAVFEVEDTGVGLSESDKSRLFTEGGKGEESLKLNVNSTGYGLYIVKKIVENHHGKIWAESEGRGKGSIFYAVFDLVR